jgi:hypothetical protein
MGKFFWWKKRDEGQEEELAHEIASTIKFMQDRSGARINQLTLSTRLYGKNTAFNLIGSSFSRASSNTASPNNSRLGFNLCASVVDTITAQVAKNKVQATFITSGGTWGLQRKAELLNKFGDGLFYENKAHEKVTYQARDSGVWGDGILFVFRDSNDRVRYERVLPHELEVDLVEASTNPHPRQMHRTKVADRGVTAEYFQGDDQAVQDILEGNPTNFQQIGGQGTAADLITIIESWHLPSGKDADDGLHVISLPDSGKILFKEKYKKDYFPFVILPYTKNLVGYWGQGACERLQDIQGELNRLMILDQKSRWMQASFKILVENSSKVVSQHLNNEVGAIIRYTNTPPQYITPPAIDNSNAQKIDSLKRDGYEQEGVSQLSSAAMKPLGVDSGKAMRTLTNLAEDRQLFFGQRVEAAALELLRQSIELVKDIHKEGKKYTVLYPSSHFIETIEWSDINLEADEFWLKAFPTSALSEDPAEKLQTVQEYVQAGFITPRAARRLLSSPDVEMADKLANAAEDFICKIIEDIIYDGKMTTPDAEMDLTLCKQYCLQYLNYAKINGCPAKFLKKLRAFMALVDDQLGLTLPPPPPALPPGAPGSPGAPQANPMPTPTSDMVPNVPMQGAA